MPVSLAETVASAGDVAGAEKALDKAIASHGKPTDGESQAKATAKASGKAKAKGKGKPQPAQTKQSGTGQSGSVLQFVSEQEDLVIKAVNDNDMPTLSRLFSQGYTRPEPVSVSVSVSALPSPPLVLALRLGRGPDMIALLLRACSGERVVGASLPSAASGSAPASSVSGPTASVAATASTRPPAVPPAVPAAVSGTLDRLSSVLASGTAPTAATTDSKATQTQTEKKTERGTDTQAETKTVTETETATVTEAECECEWGDVDDTDPNWFFRSALHRSVSRVPVLVSRRFMLVQLGEAAFRIPPSYLHDDCDCYWHPYAFVMLTLLVFLFRVCEQGQLEMVNLLLDGICLFTVSAFWFWFLVLLFCILYCVVWLLVSRISIAAPPFSPSVLLLAAGANPTLKDAKSQTPYQLCKTKAAREAIRLFAGRHPNKCASTPSFRPSRLPCFFGCLSVPWRCHAASSCLCSCGFIWLPVFTVVDFVRAYSFRNFNFPNFSLVFVFGRWNYASASIPPLTAAPEEQKKKAADHKKQKRKQKAVEERSKKEAKESKEREEKAAKEAERKAREAEVRSRFRFLAAKRVCSAVTFIRPFVHF